MFIGIDEPPSLGGEGRFMGDRGIGQTRASPPAEPGLTLILSYRERVGIGAITNHDIWDGLKEYHPIL